MSYKKSSADLIVPPENEILGLMPIYAVGDSHVLPLKNMVIRHEATRQLVAVRSKYISGLSAAGFFDASKEEFHPEFIKFLEYEGLVREGRAVHLSRSETDFNIAKASAQPMTPPLLLLSMGDIDVRGGIMPKLRDEYDFIPPFETRIPVLDKPLLPWNIVERFVEESIKPVTLGLKRLFAAGFTRVYVQGVVPPTQDEPRVEELHGYACPLSVRTKLVMAFNRELSKRCQEAGAVFLDVWPQLTDGLYLRAEFEVDGVHVPPRAARYYVDAVLEHAINCQWLAANYVRHEMFYRMACGLSPFEEDRPAKTPLEHGLRQLLAEVNRPPRTSTTLAPQAAVNPAAGFANHIAEFRNKGITVIPLDKTKAIQWLAAETIDRDVGNRHPAWDWAGNTIEPFSKDMQSGLPSEQLVDDLTSLFSGEDFQNLFSEILGCNAMIGSCRVFKSLPHPGAGIGPQFWHEDGCPSGVIRGVLYLTDVNEFAGPFQYKDGDGEHSVLGEAGSLLIFDANRLSHRGSPPTKFTRAAIDFVFMPRLPGQPFRLVVAGMNNWPADPFCYSVPAEQH